MPTQTGTAVASGVMPKAVHAGVNSVSFSFDQGGTSTEASATTFLMGKIPSGSTILDIIHKTTYPGSGACPADVGITNATGSLSALASQLTCTTVGRAAKGVPYDVDASQTVTAGYETLKVTITPATATTSIALNTTVLYTMDKYEG